jgi:hypothetical protein
VNFLAKIKTMAIIDTQLGKLTYNPGTATSASIPLFDAAFSTDLAQQMESARTRLSSKSINLSKVHYLAIDELRAMVQQTVADGKEEALLFYVTDGGASTTFTIIGANSSLKPFIGPAHTKWRLNQSLAYNWSPPPVIPNDQPVPKVTKITNYFNPLLIPYSHKLEEGTDFMKNLTTRSGELFTKFQAGTLPMLKIAGVLKKDLSVFTNDPKYSGVLLYLNQSPQERMVNMVNGDVIVETKRERFVSISIVGVAQDWDVLVAKGEEKLTLLGICPPDCPIYNNN